MQKTSKNLKGFSITEILVVLALMSIVSISVYLFSVDALRFSENRRNKNHAILKLNETMNAVLLNKENLWRSIINSTDDGQKHISFNNGSYQIVDGETVEGAVTLSFEIDEVYRDASGNITTSENGNLDTNTRVMNLTASWSDSFGYPAEVTSLVYITNWNTPVWDVSGEADFILGTMDDTIVTSSFGGAVELDLDDTVSADWCLPELTNSDADLPGNGIAKEIYATAGKVYTGTGSNSSGYSYIETDITDEFPPQVTISNTFDGYKTNNVIADGNYVYLTTDTNSQELIILDIGNPPNANLVGWADTSGSSDGLGIWKSGNNIFMTTEDGKLHVIDVTNPVGAKSISTSFTLAGTGYKLMIRGDYAFVITSHNNKELQILNISNINNITESGYANVPGISDPLGLYVNESGTRAYIGTIFSFSEEIYIINTESKSGSRSIIESIETGWTSIIDLTYIEEDDILIAVGLGGTEYQVFDLENEQNADYCGGLNLNEVVTGVEGVKFPDSGNGFAYVVTVDTNAELKVIKGGPIGGGGGNGNGSQYLEMGSYDSDVFDTGSSQSQYYWISWEEEILEGTDIRLQVRAGNNQDLSASTWLGPDGNSDSFFTNSELSEIPNNLQNKRYFQYKVYLTSNKINTPIFHGFKLNYEK